MGRGLPGIMDFDRGVPGPSLDIGFTIPDWDTDAEGGSGIAASDKDPGISSVAALFCIV